MNENYKLIINPIAVAQQLVTARTTKKLREAVKAIHLNCLTQPLDTVREIAKHLLEISKGTLIDHVREAVKTSGCSENASIALKDVENLVSPAFPAPILSQEACQLARDIKYLPILKDYCNRRLQLLNAIEHLASWEAEAVSGRLAERLGDLLIFEVLVENMGSDKLLDRQLWLWKILHFAQEKGQLQIAPYFLELDEKNNLQSLLPCYLPLDAPAKVFYGCASILKTLAYQQDVWEYDSLMQDLYDKVDKKVTCHIMQGMDDEDTLVLEELFVLLRTVVNNHSLVAWENPRFEQIKKELEEI